MHSIPSGTVLASIPTDVLEAFGIHTGGRVTRAQAMGIPAMRRGRNVIAGTIGTIPLVARRPTNGQLVNVTDGTTATLLGQLDPRTTPQWTVTWTVDSMLFYGIAWWRVTARDSYGWPQAVEWLNRSRVSWDTRGQVTVDGVVTPDRDLIRFDGPDSGVLVDGVEPLRTCILLEAAVRRNSTGLPPMDILRPAEGAPDLTDLEAQELLDTWAGYRNERGTAWLNRAVEHQVVGFDPRAGQLAEARQHQAVEVARMLNLDATELNAPAATGMTYSNSETKRRDLLDVSLAPYITALTQRLSMPDVTPRGQRVELDTSAFLRGTTSDRITAAVEATGGAAVMTSEEAREGLLGLPGTPEAGQLLPAPAARPEGADRG